MNKTNKKTDTALTIVCFISTISQIPFIYESVVLSNLVSISWLILFGYLMLLNNLTIKIHPILALPIIFDLFCLVAEFNGNKYLSANLFRSVNLCTFIFIIGLNISDFFSFETLKKFVIAFITGTTITSLIVYFQFCFGRSVTANSYLYNGKNSLSSIILIAFVFTILMKQYVFNTRFKNILFFGLVGFYIYLLFILKSRTTLVCLVAFFAWYIFSSQTRFRTKILMVLLIVVAVGYVISNPELYDTIVNIILLNGKEATDLNAITSNRLEHFEMFLNKFPESPLIGFGGFYVESFPLTALLSFGALGAVWIFCYVLAPVISALAGLKNKNKNRLLSILLFVISIMLILNGIAEELPPFGPGVKCFAMWLLFGIYCGKSKYINNYK